MVKNIEKLKDQIMEDLKNPIEINQEEQAIAVMAETEGWKILMRKYRKTIADLLEPIQKSDISVVRDLALIGAMAIARRERIDGLTEFINEVESIKKARRIMQEQKKKKGESK